MFNQLKFLNKGLPNITNDAKKYSTKSLLQMKCAKVYSKN